MAKDNNTVFVLGAAAILLYWFGKGSDSKQATDVITLGTLPVDAIKQMIPYAIAEANAAPKPGISIDFILAQSGWETGWWKLTNTDGTPTIFAASNNAFGIHADSTWTGDTYTPPGDPNNAPFRKYASVADSFADHLAYLVTNQNYAPLWNSGTDDPIVWASIIDDTGYSQTPGYGADLAEIIPTIQQITGQ